MSHPVESPYLKGNFAPVEQELTKFDLRVTGRIPRELRGRLLRIGPNPVGPVDPATYHWFTGSGMVHGVRIRDGRAEWYRNRYVRIVEAGNLPVELSDDLETVQRSDFAGTLDGSFTAHPKRDPLTGDLHAVTYYFEWDHIRYVVVGANGLVKRSVHVPVPDAPMVHDCAITETKVILLDLPVTFQPEAMEEGATFPYLWNPHHEPRVGLLPRNGEADDVQWFGVEPCYVFHPLNAYDLPDGRVVLDVVRHPSMFATHRLAPNEGPPTLDRWTLDPRTGTVREERLDDRGQEFPRHDERRIGRPIRYGYTAGFARDLEHGPALKHDLVNHKTEVHEYGPGRVTLEPVFVPRAPDAEEDDGWILSYVYDANTDKSDVVILHAQDFQGEPVATIHLPQRVPFGFHGNWVPDPD
jgi:carotenoid cleavage dioxygenase